MSEGESKFGFKDMEKALETLKLLESHDMQYRKLTVRGLLGRAKRVLTSKIRTNPFLFTTILIHIDFHEQ